MSQSLDKQPSQLENFVLLNPRPEHFLQIQELCKKVYPFSKPWSLAQLESHHSYFPDGQLIVLEKKSNKVVGLAFSLIIVWNDYSPQDSWVDYTSGGFFYNHNPKQGKTLYGAEVMVDPEYRGKGIGRLLYEGREQIVKKYGLKRIRAGARLRGYSKFKDALTPYQYTRSVVEKKIYDPTLSFQLNRGFKVINVAANYLYNDPESLGYAAVIEWLSPDNNSEVNFEKQNRSARQFLESERYSAEDLPKELRRMVRKATTALGLAINDIEGEKFLNRVEYYRESLKKLRSKERQQERLKKLFDSLKKENKDCLFKIAHAFSLQLEIINVCEASYRTWRLRQKPTPQSLKKKLNLTYVLTAHPTEARDSKAVKTLHSLQNLLIEGTHNNFSLNNEALLTTMRTLWLQPFSKNQKPSVQDEADYIYSLIFDSDIFNFLLEEKPSYDLYLHSWVGGDKDGHPGVNKDVMQMCLSKSRSHILKFLDKNLMKVIADLETAAHLNTKVKMQIEGLSLLKKSLETFKPINLGDGSKIKAWTTKYSRFIKSCDVVVKSHNNILQINKCISLFPALVLPIELREDSRVIASALSDHNQSIFQMLTTLNKIARPLPVTAYASSFIISHCMSADDIQNACKLVDLTNDQSSLPVVPLFEDRDSLSSIKNILTLWLKQKKNRERVRRYWNDKFEIMLGYSDSAKEVGVFSSRFLIAKSMHQAEQAMRAFKVKPVFFHGSGGSVARGGGSIKEQIAWWSRSAIDHPKITIQGEMIQRQFATQEILNSTCASYAIEAIKRKTKKTPYKMPSELVKFNSFAQKSYTELVNNKDLLNKLLDASPYHYLNALKIGSRPTSRPSNQVNLNNLRAIPWVLCWTQTRSLLPTWWGAGSAWDRLDVTEKEKLKSLLNTDPFFSSYLKALGFSLAKVRLDVWGFYFKSDSDRTILDRFKKEYQAAVHFVQSVTGVDNLLWFRPWLGESIQLRSPHVDLLNLIQVLSIQKNDEDLLRETIVGIASGMLTTG